MTEAGLPPRERDLDMPDEPFHRLPGQVTVESQRVLDVIKRLERMLEHLEEQRDPSALKVQLDDLIGVLTRWLWPLLDEIDDENGS